MQDQSAASWRAVRHPRSSAPASDAATPPIGGARPTGTRQAGISTFAGNAMTLPPGTIVSPFDAGPHPGGMKKSRRSSAAPSLAEIGSEDRSRHDLPRHKKRHPRKASLMNRYFLPISLSLAAAAAAVATPAAAEPFQGPYPGAQAGWNENDVGTAKTDIGSAIIHRPPDAARAGVLARKSAVKGKR